MIINNIEFNNSFGRGKPGITSAQVSDLVKNATKLIKVGDGFVGAYPSTYKADYFRKLAKAAKADEAVLRAKATQEVLDIAEREKSYLDINI